MREKITVCSDLLISKNETSIKENFFWNILLVIGIKKIYLAT